MWWSTLRGPHIRKPPDCVKILNLVIVVLRSLRLGDSSPPEKTQACLKSMQRAYGLRIEAQLGGGGEYLKLHIQ